MAQPISQHCPRNQPDSVMQSCENEMHLNLGNCLKYQGVKEFHMPAHIGLYCKIKVFSPLKLDITYYHFSKDSK